MKNDSVIMLGGSYDGILIHKGVADSQPTRPNQLSIVGGVLVRAVAVNGSLIWEQAVDPRELAYEFTTFSFTAAGTTGRYGPTSEALARAYLGAPFMASSELFHVDDGIQKWMVPDSGIYNIFVRAPCHFSYGAPSCKLEVTLPLLMGDVLSMVVGQFGATAHDGCGGSFVASANRGLIAIAGGGGGYNGTSTRSAVTTTYDEDSNVSSAGGRTVVSAAVEGASSYGGGGAGYSVDGAGAPASAPVSGRFEAALSFLNGAIGGFMNGYGSGGFGGGGGGSFGYRTRGMGGGGGYTGGDGSASTGSDGGSASAFGGTNFCTNRNIISRVAASSANRGDTGLIRITKVG